MQDALEFGGLLIDRHHDGPGSRRLDAIQHFTIVVEFQLRIKLKPQRAFGRRRDLFERKAGDIAHNVRSIGCGGGALIGCQFPIRVQHAVTGGRRHHDGEIHRGAKNLGCRLDRPHIEYAIGNQFHPIKRLAVAPQRELAIRTVSRVVVVVPRNFGIGHGLEVECRDEFLQPGNAAVVAERILLRTQQRRAGQETCHGPEGVPSV